MVQIYTCKLCNHTWASRKNWLITENKRPYQCPKCKNPRWFEDVVLKQHLEKLEKHDKEQHEQRQRSITKKCHYCNSEFSGYPNSNLFCSKKCETYYWKNRLIILYKHLKGGIGKNEEKLLKEIEDKTGFKIIRQFRVLNYFVDGYIKELNLAIEIDEKYHENQKEKDKNRQDLIENELGCKFIRIKDYSP